MKLVSRHMKAALAAGILALIALEAWTAPVRVSLQFDSPLSASQAPFFLAVTKGWFRSAGVEARLLAGTDQASAIAAVNAGKADIGIADAAAVLAYRSRGMPLVIIASLGDKSSSCAYFLSASKIAAPQDLAGKKIAVDPFDGQAVLFPLFAEANGLRTGDVTFLTMSFPQRIEALATGTADAIFGTLQQNQVLGRAFGRQQLGRLLWADFGFDLYGTCLFVRRDSLGSKPGAIRAFLSAAFKSWEFSLRNPDQAVAALGSFRSIQHDEALQLSDELADLTPLFNTPVYRLRGIGYMDPARMDATLSAVSSRQGIPLSFKTADAMSAALLPKPPVRMPAEKPAAPASAPAAAAPAVVPGAQPSATPAAQPPAAP